MLLRGRTLNICWNLTLFISSCNLYIWCQFYILSCDIAVFVWLGLGTKKHWVNGRRRSCLGLKYLVLLAQTQREMSWCLVKNIFFVLLQTYLKRSLRLIRNTSYCHCKQSRGLPNVSFKTRSYVTTNIAGDIQCPCLLSQTWVELSWLLLKYLFFVNAHMAKGIL